VRDELLHGLRHVFEAELKQQRHTRAVGITSSTPDAS